MDFSRYNQAEQAQINAMIEHKQVNIKIFYLKFFFFVKKKPNNDNKWTMHIYIISIAFFIMCR